MGRKAIANDLTLKNFKTPWEIFIIVMAIQYWL